MKLPPLPPDFPLEGATGPHPDGLRLALGEGVAPVVYLHPAEPRSQAEADEDAARIWAHMNSAFEQAIVQPENSRLNVHGALLGDLWPPPLSPEPEEQDALNAVLIAFGSYLTTVNLKAAGPIVTIGGTAKLTADGAAPAPSRDMSSLAVMQAVGLPLALARSGMFAPPERDNDEQLALDFTTKVLGSLRYKDVIIRSPGGQPMHPRAGLMSSYLTKIFSVQAKAHPGQSRSASCLLPMTATDFCRACGYKGRGTWELRRSLEHAMSLRSYTHQLVHRLPDGSEEYSFFGLVEAGWMKTGKGGRGEIRISPEFVELIESEQLAIYNPQVLFDLVNANPYAAALWMFLEGETLKTPRRYSIFSAPSGEPPVPRDTPAIADLLNLREKGPGHRRGWSRRRDIVRHIRKDAKDLQAHDPRYTITVEPAKVASMWNLRVSKACVPGVALPVENCVPLVAPPAESGTTSRAECVPLVAQSWTTSRAADEEVLETTKETEMCRQVLPSYILPSSKELQRSRPKAAPADSLEGVSHQDSDLQRPAANTDLAVPTNAFGQFWDLWPEKYGSPKLASQEFAKLSPEEQQRCLAAGRNYAEAIARGIVRLQYLRRAENFISQKRGYYYQGWVNGIPGPILASYRNRPMTTADMLQSAGCSPGREAEAIMEAFGHVDEDRRQRDGLLRCYVCQRVLSVEERDDPTIVTKDESRSKKEGRHRHRWCEPPQEKARQGADIEGEAVEEDADGTWESIDGRDVWIPNVLDDGLD